MLMTRYGRGRASLRFVGVLVALSLAPSVAPAMPGPGCPHHEGIGGHGAHGGGDAGSAPGHRGEDSGAHVTGHHHGILKGHRVAAEFHLPVRQSLNGPQPETDWILTVGWQKSFEPIGHH